MTGSALHAAARYGSVKLARLLVSYGADVNIQGQWGITPLREATCHRTHAADMVTFLVGAGAEVDIGFTRLPIFERVVSNGDNATLSALIEGGIHPDINGGQALQVALAKCKIASAELLVAGGADVRLAVRGGPYGSTLSAAASGGVESLRYLLEKCGVGPNRVDLEGRTALHVAVRCQDVQAVRYLTGLGLDINHEDGKGWSAIHYAALADNITVLRVLLSTTTPVSRIKAKGWSPLHLACQNNGPEALDLLLRHGFCPTTVATSVPERQWDLYDIAWAYANRRLVDENGRPNHDILHDCLKKNPRVFPGPLFPLKPDWFCDGCVTGNVSTVMHVALYHANEIG